MAYEAHHCICNMQANFKGFFSPEVFWGQESCEISSTRTHDTLTHPSVRSKRQYMGTGSSAVRTVSATTPSIGLNHIIREIQNLPPPSHTPIKSLQHFNSTPLLLKIGWTRAVLSQRSCGQGRLQPSWLSQKKPQLHSHHSWAVSQIPIKNLHFPKNSEQLSPKMSRCWALLSEKARAFSKWNRLLNKEFRVTETRKRSIWSKHSFPPSDTIYASFLYLSATLTKLPSLPSITFLNRCMRKGQ